MKETRFKQTEIGLIPVDWEVKELNEIASTSSGGTPSRSNKKYFQGGISWFTTGELQDCKLTDSIEHISEEAVKYSSVKFYNPGTILMAMYGATIGKLGILTKESTSNQACCAIKCERIFNIYLFYYLLSQRQRIIEKGFGAAQPNISQEIIKRLRVLLPTAIEQERIGEAFSEIDNLIDGLKKLVEKKKGIKEATMSQLLSGKRRLSGFNKPWETKIMDEVGFLIPNNSLAWEFLTNNGMIANIHYGDILTRFGSVLNVQKTQLPYIVSSHEKKFYKSKKIQNGDIIFADTAEDDAVGKAIEIQNVKNVNIISGLHTIWFRPLKYFSPGFMGYLLNDNSFHNQIPPLATGTKVNSISKPNLLRLNLHYPKDLEEQGAIAKVLTDMDKEIEALERKVEKYENIKKGMMNQLLTGKIRLI